MTPESTKEKALAALRAGAWEEPSKESTCGHPGCTEHRAAWRKIVHCFIGSFGADWPLRDAEELIARASSVAWELHPLGHDLAVTAEGKTYRFAVRKEAK